MGSLEGVVYRIEAALKVLEVLGEPGRPQSIGSQGVRHDWNDNTPACGGKNNSHQKDLESSGPPGPDSADISVKSRAYVHKICRTKPGCRRQHWMALDLARDAEGFS